MIWARLIGLAGMLGSVLVTNHYTPARNASAVGSFYVALVKNPTPDSVLVAVIAPRVDSAIRPLGALAPHDSGWARLPYADPPLILLYIPLTQPKGGWWHTIPPDSVFFRPDSTGRKP